MAAPSLKINRIELFKLSIPLIEPFITSLGRDDNAENLIAKISTREGLTGWGECSPYMPINGESQDTCFIVGQYLARVLKDKDPLDIEQATSSMDNLIYGNSSIKSAFDMALYDIASQNAGVPLYKFLGGKNDKTITTDYTVSIGDKEKMARDAVKIKNDGFPAIKVKLGKNGKTDIERMKAVRNAVGPDIPLRIDANQGWGVEEAIETLQGLASVNVQYCEEPISRASYMRLPEVRKASPIPIMADECCGDHHDAERLIHIGACDMMNIKLGKSGGIYKALKMVRLAEKNDIHLQIGAFMESRLAMTAFAHFALCSPAIRHFDFDTALMFVEDPVKGGIVYGNNGLITVPDVPGLGAEIKESTLHKLETVIV